MDRRGQALAARQHYLATQISIAAGDANRDPPPICVVAEGRRSPMTVQELDRAGAEEFAERMVDVLNGLVLA